MTDYAHVKDRLSRLNDPEARWELGEDARRAELAALADAYLLELIEANERLSAILYPKLVEKPA